MLRVEEYLAVVDDDYCPLRFDMVAKGEREDKHHAFLLREQLFKSFLQFKRSWLRCSLDQLLYEFGEDDWDGDGALRVSYESYRTAVRFLDEIMPWPIPEVTIDTRGKVCFEWGSVYSQYLLVKFGVTGTVSCFYQQSATSELRCHKSLPYWKSVECLKMLPSL